MLTLKIKVEKILCYNASTMQNRIFSYVALLLGILALTLSSFFLRFADAPPLVTTFYRMLVASLVLIPFGIHGLRHHPIESRADLRYPISAGFFSALDHILWSSAIFMTKVAHATLLNNFAPLWVALFTWLIWKYKLRSKFWFGVTIAILGAAIVMGSSFFRNLSFSKGEILAFLSSFCYAGYFLITEQGRARFSSIVYVWIAAVASALTLLIVNLITHQPLAGYSTQTYLIFMAAGLISQVGGYFLLAYALGKLPAAIVSPSMVLQPVLTILLAVPLLGEPITLPLVLGGICVLTGIYLVISTPPVKVSPQEISVSG